MTIGQNPKTESSATQRPRKAHHSTPASPIEVWMGNMSMRIANNAKTQKDVKIKDHPY
jgi:hypothetical protein